MWGCYAQKRVCRAVLSLTELAGVNSVSSLLEAWSDSVGKEATSRAESLACLRGVDGEGYRYDEVLLLVMARYKPKLQFFARLSWAEEAPNFEHVLPTAFPFTASLRMGPSFISPAHRAVRIVTNETLAQEVAEYDMAWSLHPLDWELPARNRLVDHVVTGMQEAFVRPQPTGRRRQTKKKAAFNTGSTPTCCSIDKSIGCLFEFIQERLCLHGDQVT